MHALAGMHTRGCMMRFKRRVPATVTVYPHTIDRQAVTLTSPFQLPKYWWQASGWPHSGGCDLAALNFLTATSHFSPHASCMGETRTRRWYAWVCRRLTD